MQVVLPLDKMTAQVKMCGLEEIWDDFARTPLLVPSPDWHGEEVKVREDRLAKGLFHFSDWSEEKRKIREQVQ